jgi:TolA-binding protein
VLDKTPSNVQQQQQQQQQQDQQQYVGAQQQQQLQQELLEAQHQQQLQQLQQQVVELQQQHQHQLQLQHQQERQQQQLRQQPLSSSSMMSIAPLDSALGGDDAVRGLIYGATVRFSDSAALRLRRRAMVVWEQVGAQGWSRPGSSGCAAAPGCDWSGAGDTQLACS